MNDTPRILQTTAQPTAMIFFDIPRAEMMKVFGPGVQELFSTLAAQGVTPAGPITARHLKMSKENFTFELSVPVSRPITPAGRVQNSELPAATVARTIYRGPYEGLYGAWAEFEAWIVAQGKKSGASIWEAYAKGPADSADPSTWETELTRVLEA